MSLIDQYEIDRQLLKILFEMEKTGIYVHKAKLEEEYLACTLKIGEIDRYLKATWGLDNPQSTKQLTKFLTDDLALPLWETTEKDSLKTDAATLRRLITSKNFFMKDEVSEAVQLLFQRAANKTARGYFANYLDFLQSDSVVHPSFDVGNTKTFRLSSSNPNLQNISNKETSNNEYTIDARQMFGPRPGYIWFAMDFSQIELRVYAHCSKEPKMLEVYKFGGDLHERTRASIAYLNSMEPKQGRKYAKHTNFTTIYEGTPWTLYFKYGMPTDAGEECVHGFWNTYTIARDFNDRSFHKANKDGEITTIFGRKLQIPHVNGKLKAKTTAVNYQIQSAAADLMKKAMIRCAEFLSRIPHSKCRMVLTVHDEVIFEIHKTFLKVPLVQKLKDLMEDHGGILSIPTPVDVAIITDHWGKKVSIDI